MFLHFPGNQLDFCPVQWTNWSGFCYKYFLSDKGLTKEKADSVCKINNGSRLIDIQSAKENNFTLDFTSNKKGLSSTGLIWLGLEYINGIVKWDRGILLNDYYKTVEWRYGVKPGNVEACAVMSTKFSDWATDECSRFVSDIVCKTGMTMGFKKGQLPI